MLVLGLVAGLASATLGIGGGVIYVPALITIFGFSQHIAQGTSLAIIFPTVVVAAWLHARNDRVNWKVALLVGVSGIIGALAGSALALSLDPTLLRRLFAALLIVIAIRLLSK